MQIILLIVNFFLITIISREYGAEIYGEYASAKSLSVLLGTAIVLSLALVVTRTSSNIEKFDKNLFYTTYKTIIRNTILASFLVFPLSAIFGRNYIYVFIFLLGFVFNEMLHVALAFHQSKGDFVISSKQIILRTVIYGLGGWLIIYFQYSIFWVIVFQTFLLLIFYFVANNSLPKEESNTDNTYTSKELRKSGRKMVLTTLSAALISELDIVILGVFYSGPILGVLAWSRRILEGLHQLVGASLDIVFPEISKLKNISEINEIRSKLKLVILVSLFIPLLYLALENAANNIFINVLGTEFIDLASIFRVVIFSLPFMLWSRVNIIFARAMHFEINLFKVVITAAAISYLIYFFISQYNLFSPEFGILSSQITFSLFTSVFVGRQIKVGIESR
jgi:O-antigen/teichoic acid export membrane protein